VDVSTKGLNGVQFGEIFCGEENLIELLYVGDDVLDGNVPADALAEVVDALLVDRLVRPVMRFVGMLRSLPFGLRLYLQIDVIFLHSNLKPIISWLAFHQFSRPPTTPTGKQHSLTSFAMVIFASRLL
jgi:hypothetical protein